jgi:hypothetical protein
MDLGHDRDFPGVQPDEIPRWIDTEQLNEPPHQVLIELRPVIPLQHGKDPIGRERLLILTLRSHRVVHVGDAAQHRRQVQCAPPSAGRIARPIDPEVMLECNHRREHRHLRRPAQDLGAVDCVPLHDLELCVGEGLGFGQDLLGRAHLADVVHQRR